MALVFRALEKGDFTKGFLNLIKQATVVGDVTRGQFETKFDLRARSPGLHTIVGVCGGKLACSATLLIEEKFIHNCSRVGHIEDVVVDSEFRGRGFGKGVIKELVQLAKNQKCYKVILDCDDANVPFYQSCGLSKKGTAMAVYFE